MRTVALPSLQLLLGIAAQRRLDPGSLLARAGIARELIAPDASVPDTERRVPIEPVLRVWELLLEETRDRAISLALPAAPPSRYDALGLAITTATSVREAWTRASRYMRAWGGFASFELVEDGLDARIVFAPEPLDRAGAWLSVEASVAITCAFARGMLGGDLPLREVRFAHATPTDVAPFTAHFGAKVVFGAARTELVLDGEVLERALPAVPDELAAYVTRQAEALVARLPAIAPTSHAVRRLLASELVGGEPVPARIARKLAMSERTLRRRLEAEGTSFADILVSVRREAAERALREARLGLGEIAFQLGFSEASAFSRAFKRWTGQSPAEFRSRQPS